MEYAILGTLCALVSQVLLKLHGPMFLLSSCLTCFRTLFATVPPMLSCLTCLMPLFAPALRTSVLHVFRVLFGLLSYVDCALRALVPRVPCTLCALVIHLCCTLGAFPLLLPHLLQVFHAYRTLIQLIFCSSRPLRLMLLWYFS